jgi:hypothetical protein
MPACKVITVRIDSDLARRVEFAARAKASLAKDRDTASLAQDKDTAKRLV